MAARSSWKGYIKISLVSVPVKAYTATNSGSTISLNQLHAPCNNRIKYQKVCPVHGEVPNEEIVSGYEFAKGQYAIIDTGELAVLRAEGDKSINVSQFVAEADVNDRYLSGSCYFLVPDGPIGQKAYALVRNVMKDSSLCGIAQIVMFNKEQLVLLRPIENLIGMYVLRHASEIKLPSAFSDEVGETQVTSQELKLTKQLMEGLKQKKFDMEQFTDTYTEKLTELIQSKVEGKELVTPESVEEPQVINLMEALKASLEKVKPAATQAPKKRAPSKPTRDKKETKRTTAAKSSPARKRKSG